MVAQILTSFLTCLRTVRVLFRSPHRHPEDVLTHKTFVGEVLRTPEQQPTDEIETYALSLSWDRNGWSRGLPPSFNILTDPLFTTILNSSLFGIAVHSEFQMVQFLQNLETTSSVPLFRALACFFQLVHQCATVGNCVAARNHRFFAFGHDPTISHAGVLTHFQFQIVLSCSLLGFAVTVKQCFDQNMCLCLP